MPTQPLAIAAFNPQLAVPVAEERAEMTNVIRFTAVLLAFVAAISGVVWTTASSERQAAKRDAQERKSTDDMLAAFLARESALRGYAESGRPNLLESYRDAHAALEDAIERAREGANGDEEEELAPIAEQERLAERWATVADGVIARVKSGRAETAESALIRNDLVDRFQRENAALLASVEEESSATYRQSVKRAVALIVLLSAVFGTAGGLLMLNLSRKERRRRATETNYHSSQREFAETLQVTESEAEAHALVKRHLERSLAAEIVVLNRNNSQNRLEAATPVHPDRTLSAKLIDSSPKSCLAVRLGRTHEQALGQEPLLACALCADEQRTTCVPSLVGGEVIGSVLISHDDALSALDRSRIDESVSQAAPVLANLRNLAIAEVRAATDALTGLPNARALRDNLVRMVAQSDRSGLPLSVVLCDLDHFKEINDVYGHEQGDAALAAASAALRDGLRDSDLAGRYGGEEFLILLPDTPLDGALKLAEKLRAGIGLVEIPGVDRRITASFGVASFPADAADGTALVRTADRALYAAKAAGRNCVVGSAELLAGTSAPS
jgi:diguanylate cyclase (GGDEF)-like protein